MEIPTSLKNLYRHWNYHINFSPNIRHLPCIDNYLLADIEKFISERMFIWEQKVSSVEQAYSSNIILKKYRFCNVYREFDRQTIFYHTILARLREEFDLWLLNMVFCRFVCNTETINDVGLLSYDIENNYRVLQKLNSKLSPKYGNAYVFPISLIIKSKYLTREEFFCLYLPSVMPSCAKTILNFQKISVVEAIEKVLPVFGYNFRFHWTEIFIDIAYQYPNLINLFDKFPIGPGSDPTIRLLSTSKDCISTCCLLPNIVLPSFPYPTIDGRRVWLSTENWEGIGCEFRKYTNLSSGFGRKRFYKAKCHT